VRQPALDLQAMETTVAADLHGGKRIAAALRVLVVRGASDAAEPE
jgi:hypothetical protein